MEFQMESTVCVTMEHDAGSGISKHIHTDFNLSVSNNLDKNHYLDEDDLPTAAGTKSLTVTLIQGLVGNIHQADQKGYWESADHLRYIIKELERGFAAVATVEKSHFNNKQS